MHTDGKEDGRSIEDILASIRRLITDASDATGAVSPVPPSFASLAEALDRDGGFEVPAMFRAPYSGDSGRSAPAPGYEPLDEMRAEGASAFPEPSTDANRPQAEQPNASAPEPWFDALSAAARTLESMQSGAFGQGPHAAPGSEGTAQDRQPPAPSPTPGAQLSAPRTMVPCTDTVIGRMGQAPRQPDPSPPSPAGPETPQLLAAALPMMSSAAEKANRSGWTSPDPANDAQTSRRLEDAAAAALRPLLREWLDNNMRLILERALKDELSSAGQKKKS
jgi:cell pole-organizing protein PopZ